MYLIAFDSVLFHHLSYSGTIFEVSMHTDSLIYLALIYDLLYNPWFIQGLLVNYALVFSHLIHTSRKLLLEFCVVLLPHHYAAQSWSFHKSALSKIFEISWLPVGYDD